jgi:hypothetical protein
MRLMVVLMLTYGCNRMGAYFYGLKSFIHRNCSDLINTPSFCYRIIRSSRNTSNPMAALLVMIAGAKLYYHSFTVGLRCDVTLNVIQEVYR